MSIYTELEGLCFLALLLMFSSVTLSISQTPLASSYSRSASVPLMTSRYAPPINDRNRKERRWGRGHFSKCFLSQNSRSKKINTLHYPYNLIMNFEFFHVFFIVVCFCCCCYCYMQELLLGFLSSLFHPVQYCTVYHFPFVTVT